MAEDGKIYITISDKTGADDSDSSGSSSGSSTKTKKTSEQKLNEYLKHEFMHLVKSTISQAVSFSIAQIGNMSGDYATQRNVNNAKELMDQGRNIGLTTYAGAKAGVATGAKMGGVWGAVAGLVVGGISTTISGGIRIHEQAVETKKQNYEIAQLRARVGMNSVKGNNRDTEN